MKKIQSEKSSVSIPEKMGEDNQPAQIYDLNYHLSTIKDISILDKVQSLREQVLGMGKDIEEYYGQYAIKFHHPKLFFKMRCVNCEKDQFLAFVKLEREQITDSTLDITEHSSWKEIKVTKNTDLTKISSIIKKAYDKK